MQSERKIMFMHKRNKATFAVVAQNILFTINTNEI